MAEREGQARFPVAAYALDMAGALLAALGLVGLFSNGAGPAGMLPQPLGSWLLLILGVVLMGLSLPAIFRHARARAENR